MKKWLSRNKLPSPRRYVPLRYRFILLSSLLLILLLGTIAAILVAQQSHSIRSQVERKGFAVAQSLAATSKAAFVTYNYILLEQSANEASKDPDIVSVIIHDKEGRVAGYSGRADLQGKYLEDESSRRAIAASQPMSQKETIESSKKPVLDAIFPVSVPGSDLRWGTVRVLLSLEPMYQQIRLTQWIIVAIGGVGLLFGIIVASLVARRITRPLGYLTEITLEAAQGRLHQEIEVHTGDEVEVLASNFSIMIREILQQRKQLELQLKEIQHLQRYTENLLITMSDGLLSVDHTGRVATINPAACRLLGVKQSVEKGGSVFELLEDALSLRSFIEENLRDPVGTVQHEIMVERGSETQVLLASCSPLWGKDGTLDELITNLHDITEFKKLEARIRQAERLAALGTLAAGMAHEIRNPLSAIKTFVQLLPRKVEKPGFLEKFNRTVPRELERINRLVSDLLELSREPKYHLTWVDVRSLIEQCVELFEGDFSENGIVFNSRFDPSLPCLRADADQLVKAFHNLLLNGVQAMAAGGELTVEVSVENDVSFSGGAGASVQQGWMCIRFKDTGPGIDSKDVKNIFNPFYTTKDAGTGLGLAITHKVITEHGGHVEVSSLPGAGTCFSVCLPCSEEVILPSAGDHGSM